MSPQLQQNESLTGKAVRWYLCLLAIALPFLFGVPVMPTEGANYPADFLVWAILLFSPAAPAFLAALLAGIGLLLALIAYPRGNQPDTALRWTLLWMAPVVAGAIGLIQTTEQDYAFHWLLHFLGAFCYGLAVWWASRNDRRMLPSLCTAIACATALLCICGWYQRLGGIQAKLDEMTLQHRQQFGTELPEQIRQKLLQKRISGFFSDPNLFAAHLLVAGPVALLALWRGLNRLQRSRRLLLLSLAALILLITFIWTGSRGAVIGLAIGAAIGIWMHPVIQSRRWKWLLPLACMLLIAGVLFYARYNAERGGMASASVRMDYYKAAWMLFKQAPATGIGLGEYYPWYMRIRPVTAEITRDPHCAFLSALSQCGIAGGLAILAIIAFPFAECLKQTRFRQRPALPSSSSPLASSTLRLLLCSGLAAWGIHSFFQFNELLPPTVYLLPAVMLMALGTPQPSPEHASKRHVLHWLALVPCLACIILSALKIPCEKRLQLCEDDLVQLHMIQESIQQKQRLMQDTSLLERDASIRKDAILHELQALMEDMPLATAPCRMAIRECKKEILKSSSLDKAPADILKTLEHAAHQLVSRTPHRGESHCQAAWAAMAAGKWEEAEESLKLARFWFPWYATHLLLTAVLDTRSPELLGMTENVHGDFSLQPDQRIRLDLTVQNELQGKALEKLLPAIRRHYPSVDCFISIRQE